MLVFPQRHALVRCVITKINISHPIWANRSCIAKRK